MDKRPEAFFGWITAHEIGHEYWSEHVLSATPSSLNWLMIGLGIYADREYRRARDFTGPNLPVGNLPPSGITTTWSNTGRVPR